MIKAKEINNQTELAIRRMYAAAVAHESAAKELRASLQEVVDCIDDASRSGIESPFPNFHRRTEEAAQVYFSHMSEEEADCLLTMDLPRLNVGPWGERIRENFLLDGIQSLEFFKVLKNKIQQREG